MINRISMLYFLGLCVVGTTSFSLMDALPRFVLPTISTSSGQRGQLKRDILLLAAETKRGLTATPQQQAEMSRMFEQLERINPTKKPLQSPAVNGKWDLQYTTSNAILGKGGFPRVGPIVQMIDTKNLAAENSEVVSYFGIQVANKVTAELDPQTDTLTNVQFKRFSVGPIGFDAPDKFRGFLDVTYVDDDLRLSRGDKGNIFVLTRME
jgi:hypothetical protein